jgi:hypothetical protein
MTVYENKALKSVSCLHYTEGDGSFEIGVGTHSSVHAMSFDASFARGSTHRDRHGVASLLMCASHVLFV